MNNAPPPTELNPAGQRTGNRFHHEAAETAGGPQELVSAGADTHRAERLRDAGGRTSRPLVPEQETSLSRSANRLCRFLRIESRQGSGTNIPAVPAPCVLD